MSVIEKLDSVLEILNHSDAGVDEMFDAAKELLRDHGPAIRQAMLKADLWDKHSGSFSVLEAMLDAASPLVLNKLKAIDAARAAMKPTNAPGGECE